MTGVESPDPGCVHERQAAFEHGFGQPDLDELDVASSFPTRDLLRPFRDRGGIDRFDDRARRPRAGGRRRSPGLAVADDRDRARRKIVVDRARGPPEQGVDQRALAVLELADHADDGLGPGGAPPDLVDPVGKVVAIQALGEEPDVARSLVHGPGASTTSSVEPGASIGRVAGAIVIVADISGGVLPPPARECSVRHASRTVDSGALPTDRGD